jgi:CRISPR-associated protein Csd1
VITLAEDGRFLGVQDISPDGKRGKEFPSVPKTARAKTQGGVAEFLSDGIDSVFGLSPDPSKPKDAKKLRAKFDDFWSQINEAASATDHPNLAALHAFKPQPGALPDFLWHDSERWLVGTAAGDEVRLGSGAFTFSVGGELLFEDEQRIKPYWRKAFERTLSEQEVESDVGLCMITGNSGVRIARTDTPRVGNIPGIGIDGTIVSFEKSAPAFSSYGKLQSNNAPCSVSATRAYSKALQFLVDRKDHHIRIGKTKLCFWTRDQVEAESLFARLLNQPQEDEVKKFLASPWTGIPREVAHRDDFFAVTLAGNSGRIVVRHWLQGPLDRAIENFHRWFVDLELRVPPKPKGDKKPRVSGKTTEFHPLSVYWLSCVTVRDAKDIASETSSQLYRAALEHAAPSVSLIKPILDQLHSKLVRDEKYNPLYDESRFALLKLIVNRNRRETDMEIEPQLTAKTDDPAYNCGRLLAILAAAQD